MFALFRLNYHNQYYAAFPDAAQLKQIKKLWLESLGAYPVSQLLAGARRALETSEYLPTLNRMHACCRAALADCGLPSARDAYLEACEAPSPKAAHPWSHPAVYHAGRAAGWFFLAHHGEQRTWPEFRERYEHYCARALGGERLTLPEAPALQQPAEPAMSIEERQRALARLRRETGLT